MSKLLTTSGVEVGGKNPVPELLGIAGVSTPVVEMFTPIVEPPISIVEAGGSKPAVGKIDGEGIGSATLYVVVVVADCVVDSPLGTVKFTLL